MEDISRSLLIMAEPGPFRDSLHALVSALPKVNIICETDDMAEALQVVSRDQPDIVLLEGDFLAEELWGFLRKIKGRSPRTQRLILADTVRQRQEIEAPIAEAIYLKGIPPWGIVEGIEKLLTHGAPSSKPP